MHRSWSMMESVVSLTRMLVKKDSTSYHTSSLSSSEGSKTESSWKTLNNLKSLEQHSYYTYQFDL